jgi:glycosyltransferase involved in cell wall biosynthesis
MTEFPLISIIVPVYNAKKTLEHCLLSLSQQTYENYEIIVVDNNSNDNSKEIIERFFNKNINIHYIFEGIRSRGAARNTGIKNTKGTIIAMTDSDCVVPNNWIETLTYPIINLNENITQGNEKDLIRNYWTNLQQEANANFLISKTPYIDHLDTKNVAFNKEVITNIGLFNPIIKDLEDFELKIRLKKHGLKVYSVMSSVVEHSHAQTFPQIFKRRLSQGFWSVFIYNLHKNNPDIKEEELLKANNPLYFFGFFVWIFTVLFNDGPKKFYFELCTGVAWRIGILLGFIRFSLF